MKQDATKNPKVDIFIEKTKNWKKEFETLRSIALGCGLSEDLKWGNPCYTYENSNVVLIHGFKEYCAILFFKGALLNDPQGVLVSQTENTQATRQMRFSGVSEISELEAVIRSYILQAVDIEKSGQKVSFKKTSEYKMPEELIKKLNAMPELKKAFESLTPGRQRAYILHFSSPKQAKTREARIEKCIGQILEGRGLND